MAKECLVGLSGPVEGQTFEVGALMSIGRNPDNDMHLDDLQVSRKHAVIQQSERGTMVKDLGSGNGTFIGDQRILEYRLASGDVIRIGTSELRFEREGEIPAEEESASGSGVRFQSGPAGNFEATNAADLHQTLFEAPAAAAPEEQLREAQKHLKAIYEANSIITSEQNLGRLFERVMEQIFAMVPAHSGVILLKDLETGELRDEYMKTGLQGEELVVSKTIVHKAFEQGEAVITYDAADDSRFEAGASIISQNISSAMCVPLTHQEDCLGVLYVDTRGTTHAFVQGDLRLLVALAGPAAIAIKNAQYVRQIQQSYEDTLIVLANAIELRDHYTVGHTWRVTNFSIQIARELGLDEEKLKEVQMGGVLHDVGKIAIDDAILSKPGRLTEDEYALMKIHPERGAQLLQDVSFLHPLIPYCLYHHERYDGKGYPFGMKADEIPLEGRIVSVADTFDAMTSNRPYRKGLDPEIAIAEIEKGRGTQFDPECADALIRSYREGSIATILQDYFKTEVRSIACPFCSTFIRLAEGVEAGDDLECEVCHRTVRIQMQNNAYYGELLSQSGALRVGSPTPGKD